MAGNVDNFNLLNSNKKINFSHAKELNIEERKRYFRLQLLHAFVLNIAYNKSKKFKDRKASCESSEVMLNNFDVVSYIALNAASSQLQSDPSVQYMGLKKECLRIDSGSLKEKFTEVVTMGDIKHAVKDFSLKVLSYHGQRPIAESTFSQVLEFSKSLSHDKKEIKLLKLNAKETDQDQELIISCFEEMTSCIDLLREILETFQVQVDMYPILATYYHSKIKAILFKIKNLDLELLRKTYKKRKVVVLSKILEELQSTKQGLEHSYMEKSIALKTYKSAGVSLEHLAKEYAQLLVSIKNEKWAIEEIEKSDKKEQNGFS